MSDREVVLEAQHVKKYFPIKGAFGKVKDNVKAVDDVSLKLYKGETLGLVGETGCGKSTLGRTLLKLVEPTDGRIILRGTDITKYTEKQMRAERSEIQMVFQDPYTSLNPRKRVGAILEEVLAIQGIRENRQERAMEILGKVGLRREHYYRYPHEFSGGQRQRIGLARALILNPSIIVCDEPVSALDVSIQSQIINLLQDLQEERQLSYAFIAHDMSVVKYISNRIGVMYLGHIVEEAPTDDLFGMTLASLCAGAFVGGTLPESACEEGEDCAGGRCPFADSSPGGLCVPVQDVPMLHRSARRRCPRKGRSTADILCAVIYMRKAK